MIKVLGIESSCDETAVAIISDKKEIISNLVNSQLTEHSPYGGVVPEIAARMHMEKLDTLILQSLKQANLGLEALDAISVTTGPGLIGGLIVGLMTAKGIASVINKPLIAVNHLEGHALSVRLTSDVEFPFLLLLISGGHCQILIVKNVGSYQQLGTTLDDALGEAFDKVAKMLKLSYPGGPNIEKYAEYGDNLRFSFPRSLRGTPNCNFSFSGLKTAVKRTVDTFEILEKQDICDICASFQYTVTEILEDRLSNALEYCNKYYPSINSLVIAGGVASNRFIRDRLSTLATKNNFQLLVPPIELCTDNAAMIGWVGIERLKLGLIDNLNVVPKAVWPL
ncbi:tRNA N6-adenosine threonylcarbamoyltransferase [Rickettsiales bacterium Ac37b]|nr:tRNA N6-adenosine threonylcarbamoyltransferase [Rickettsiales bacterium Ac37b]